MIIKHLKIIILFVMAGFCVHSKAQDTIAITSGDKVFDKVGVEASFPGGDQAWINYLVQTLNASLPADKGAPYGYYKVIVQFIVGFDGEISDVKALSDIGFGMEEEVVRVIKRGPKWMPATIEGKPVRAYRKQPVTFVTEGDGVNIKSKELGLLRIGEDNVVTIDFGKESNKDIEVGISQGSIVPSGADNSYIVKVNRLGYATIEVYRGKKRKFVASNTFRVK